MLQNIHILRLISLIFVILFHQRIFENGYLGVDIFFVISGYLMFAQNFNLSGISQIKDFCIRRLRRIYPSLICSLPLFTLYSYFVDYQTIFDQTKSALLFTPFSAQNFFFFSEIDYFQPEIKSSVIHYWSIAVELHFYLLFAILLFSPIRFRSVLVIVSGLISFFLYKTYEHHLGAFYFLPFRIWQFAAPLVFVYLCRIISHLCYVNIIFTLVGILFVVTAFLTDSRELVVLGASLVTVFGTKLKLRRSQTLGYSARITYEGYLLHMLFIGLSPINCILMTFLSSALLERVSTYRVWVALSAGTFIVLTFLLTTPALQTKFLKKVSVFENYRIDNNTFGQEYSSLYDSFSEQIIHSSSILNKDTRSLPHGTILVVGDSFAGEFYLALRTSKLYSNDIYYYSIRLNCLDTDKGSKDNFADLIFKNSNNIELVVIDANYAKVQCDNGEIMSSTSGLDFALDVLDESDIPTVVSEPRPFFYGAIEFNFIDNLLARTEYASAKEIILDINKKAYFNRERNQQYQDEVNSLINGRALLFPFTSLICDETKKECFLLDEIGTKTV